MIDGEIVVLDERRRQPLRRCCRTRCRAGPADRLVFFAFDLMHLDGWDLTEAPLDRAQGAARGSCSPAPAERSAIQFSDHVEGDGAAFFEQAVGARARGRRLASAPTAPYVPGRSKTWLKAKALLVGDFVDRRLHRSAANGGLGALALGEWVEGELDYRGKVGTGFDAATLRRPARAARAAARARAPLDGAPKDIVWVRPVLTAHVHYANLTADGAVRHAVFKGLREVGADAAERRAAASG